MIGSILEADPLSNTAAYQYNWYLGQMLTSVGLYHNVRKMLCAVLSCIIMQKIRKSHRGASEKMSKVFDT